ncbi:MAG: twin-arginine translocase TatA/TatE family subunit [Acidobacteriota bacterium]
MFGLGVQELLIIFAIILLIFGPKKLPQLGNALGRTIRGFRKGMKEAEAEDEDEKRTPEEHQLP